MTNSINVLKYSDIELKIFFFNQKLFVEREYIKFLMYINEF